MLRGMFIIREFYRQNDVGTIAITIGEPIEPEDIAMLPKDNSAATKILKDRVYALINTDTLGAIR